MRYKMTGVFGIQKVKKGRQPTFQDVKRHYRKLSEMGVEPLEGQLSFDFRGKSGFVGQGKLDALPFLPLEELAKVGVVPEEEEKEGLGDL